MVKKGNASGRLCIIGAAILWGLAGVCIKSVTWSSFSIMASRCLISLIMLLSVKKSFKINFNKTNVIGGILTAVTGLIYIEAIKLTTAGTAIVLQYIAPILVYIFEVLFSHKKARLTEILIVAAVFCGCALSFSDQLDPSHLTGNILALISGFAYAGQIICANKKSGTPDDQLIIGHVIGIVVCTPFMFFDTNLVFDMKNIIWILIIGVFQYGLANILFKNGIQKVHAIEGSLLLTIEPIFNPIPVWIFCGEVMGPRAIIGAVIVISFVILYILTSKKRSRVS